MSEETSNRSPLHQVEELWKQWIETTSQTWQQSFATNSDPFGLTTRWLEIMEETRLNLLHETAIPNDPFTFFKQWYESSHEAWSKSSEEIIGNDKFVEAASCYMESYTTFYKNFSRLNEDYFSHLQLATRSDLTRVAELIIALENKVDSLQDASEDLQSHYPQLAAMQPLPATSTHSEPDTHLEKRLDSVEQKLDTLITLLTQTNVHQPTETTLNRIASTSNTKTRKALKTPKKVSEDTHPSIERG
jgi:polyhydroxyalkanoic acid synthase PhaR subunit